MNQLRHFGHLVRNDVLGMSLGLTEDRLERLYLAWEHFSVPLEALKEVSRERCV